MNCGELNSIAQARRQLRALGHRPPAQRLAHAREPRLSHRLERGVVQQAREGVHQFGPRARVDAQAGHAVEHRRAGAAGTSGDRRLPQAAASRNTMPKPSVSPPISRLASTNTSQALYQREGPPSARGRADAPARRPRLPRHAVEVVGVPPMPTIARCTSTPRARSAGGLRIRVSKPLRRLKRPTDRISRAESPSPRRAAQVARGQARGKRSLSTPGWMSTMRSGRTPSRPGCRG